MRKTISITIDAKIYEKYRKYCKENGLILSRKVEKLIKNELSRLGVGDEK